MSRSSNNKWCLFLLSALTAGLLWLAPARSARSAAYTYNARQRTINAGVLFVGSAADLAFPSTAPNSPAPVPDPAPYMFYVLNQRPDVKPVGWSFVNPLALSTVSTAMSNRWAGTTGAYNGAYLPGASLSPSMASYWEVALRDVSADDLQQFDVLYLAGSYIVGSNSAVVPVTLTPADNEKLRRFVDGGGQLIVDYGVGTGAQPQLFGSLPLFTGGSWTTGTDNTLNPSGSAGSLDLHPLITQPNFFGGDFSSLGAASPSGTFGVITPLPGSDYNNLFSSVLNHSGGPAVTAAQLGGGQVVMDTLNIGPAVSLATGAVLPLAFDPSAVPAANLKFLSNMISWEDTHPTENKTSHQNAAGPSSASFAAAWTYPVSGSSSATIPPPGAAVYGNYVYVTDSSGVLHAFDAIPDEPLTGAASNGSGGGTDDGLVDFGSTTAPTSYDEVWNANAGANASAPTVASYNGSTYVFVEQANGSVRQFNNVSGALVNTYTAPGKTTFSPANTPTTPNAPAPTYYDGRVYAGQPDGTMFVVGLSGGSAAGGVAIPVDPAGGGSGQGSTAFATASPAVGILGSGPVSNSIVALVPTTQDMNIVLLGARNDPLSLYSSNGQFGGFNVSRLARFSLFNLFVDTASPGRAYDSNGNNGIPAVTGDRDPVFATTNLPANVDDFFGDWDSDFVKSTTQGGNPQAGLTLHEIKALSLANTAGGGATLSAPAIDRHGDYYYVVNAGVDSYLFGIHDDIAQRNVRIKFRFRLPKTGDPSTINPTGGANWNNIDADNVNYGDTNTNANGTTNSLLDYHFVGAPVVDGQGNVYVAAQYVNPQNGTTGPAAVLCFSADQEVTAEAEVLSSNPPPALVPLSGFDATQSRYFQIDESAGNPQNPLVAIPNPGRGAGRYGQITTAGNLASVFNFGRGSGGSRQIAGNLCEPQPFTATPSGPNGGTAAWMFFHTNLAWYATFAVNGQVSGVSKSGSTLLLCDSGSSSIVYNTLYKLPTAPTVGVGKLAALTVRRAPLGTGAGGTYLSIGTVAAAPSAGGGAMVINGSTGLAAFNQQLTLIADNNRILEADADGNAVWSADATTRGGTKVDFAHPAALSQFAPNDYLVADTGNNRCVRFDRGGGVIWELTRFYDPSALMAPGQPFTLSHPSSVEVRREFFNYPDPGTLQNPGNQQSLRGQIVHYLVSDTGNDRIVEVTDTLDAAGNVLYFDLNNKVVAPGTANSVTHDHLLTWVTHTADQSGRHYQYAGASYLDIPITGASDTIEVFALVTNTRLAQPAGGQLAAASGDAPGGSIVGFNRPLNPVSFANITAATASDLIYVATAYTANTTAGAQTFPVRNPRFLHVYAPPQPAPTSLAGYAYSFLYADSNGAFDLVYVPATRTLVSYGLAFTQDSYRGMSLGSNPISADFQGNLPLRNGSASTPPIPFLPTCVQRLNDDDTNMPGINHIERYLITQSYSQGELARAPGSTAPTRLGGEIFEVDVSTSAAGVVTVDPVGGFAGAVTLSHPVGASPLTQPTYALRTTQ